MRFLETHRIPDLWFEWELFRKVCHEKFLEEFYKIDSLEL